LSAAVARKEVLAGAGGAGGDGFVHILPHSIDEKKSASLTI
jgi:hypothetical protein